MNAGERNIYQQILAKYWGFKEFRPLQEEIILTVANGQDALALLPTGGGKSLTYQVPGMALNGICLVVTPLISLMKDQVGRLEKSGIRALAVHSGMSGEEMDVALENAIYGNFKFLYLSPERIGTRLFRERVKHMQVNLVAVDEAHCISQWGYDFRPSYLRIADLREFLPGVPFLALTATATTDVVRDIQDKLRFARKKVFRGSFRRKTLVYTVSQTEDKLSQALRICEQIRGSGIIYVRSRKKARELAILLHRNGISCDYYHAGLEHAERNRKQAGWMDGKFRIMVATNAFGMGIDKADVRFVLHVDLPDSVEAYFQEAGRAGRDDRPAHAVLLFNESDRFTIDKRMVTGFPEISLIKQVYKELGNYYQVPVGAARNQVFDFNIADFAARYHHEILSIYSSLKILQSAGYIELTDEINHPSRLKFLIGRDDLYRFQVANEELDAFIKLVLRSYTGLFTDYVTIYEESLAAKAGLGPDVIRKYLNRLGAAGVVRYLPQKKTPVIIFTEERLDSDTLHFSREHYRDRKEQTGNRMRAVLEYAGQEQVCRSQYLLSYFGERRSGRCGQCDVCMKRDKLDLSRYELDMAVEEIRENLSSGNMDLDQLVESGSLDEDKTIRVIRWLLDNNRLERNEDNRLTWRKRK